MTFRVQDSGGKFFTAVARHHAADARGESEHVGDGGRVQQLVLKQQKQEDIFTSSLERERSDCPVSKKLQSGLV